MTIRDRAGDPLDRVRIVELLALLDQRLRDLDISSTVQERQVDEEVDAIAGRVAAFVSAQS